MSRGIRQNLGWCNVFYKNTFFRMVGLHCANILGAFYSILSLGNGHYDVLAATSPPPTKSQDKA